MKTCCRWKQIGRKLPNLATAPRPPWPTHTHTHISNWIERLKLPTHTTSRDSQQHKLSADQWSKINNQVCRQTSKVMSTCADEPHYPECFVKSTCTVCIQSCCCSKLHREKAEFKNQFLTISRTGTCTLSSGSSWFKLNFIHPQLLNTTQQNPLNEFQKQIWLNSWSNVLTI